MFNYHFSLEHRKSYSIKSKILPWLNVNVNISINQLHFEPDPGSMKLWLGSGSEILPDRNGFANWKFCKYTSEDDNFNLIWIHYCVFFCKHDTTLSSDFKFRRIFFLNLYLMFILIENIWRLLKGLRQVLIYFSTVFVHIDLFLRI